MILDNLPDGYEEGMQYGMIGYYVPHSLYPAGYHCSPEQPLPFASLASQKQYVSVYLYCIYSDEKEAEWFRTTWEKSGKKLNMGKSCVRFRTLDDVPLKLIGRAVKRVPVKKFIATYEAAVGDRRRPPTKAKTTKKKAKKSAQRTTAGAGKKTSAAGRTKKRIARKNG